MAINDLQKLHAAIAAVCPVDGVSGDGTIWFKDQATAQQKADAAAALSAFVDSAPSGLQSPPETITPLPTPKAITEA